MCSLIPLPICAGRHVVTICDAVATRHGHPANEPRPGRCNLEVCTRRQENWWWSPQGESGFNWGVY